MHQSGLVISALFEVETVEHLFRTFLYWQHAAADDAFLLIVPDANACEMEMLLEFRKH